MFQLRKYFANPLYILETLLWLITIQPLLDLGSMKWWGAYLVGSPNGGKPMKWWGHAVINVQELFGVYLGAGDESRRK